jgi:uncharacterized protein YndB with AHSA1/START domain
MANDQIEREVFIASPAERVWEVLTGADHLAVWFAYDGAELDLRPGGAIAFTWAEHGRFLGRVERVEVPRVLAFRWARPPDEEPRPGNSTLVEFTLHPEPGGTRLRVVERGFASLEGDRQQALKDNTAGWLGGFESLVAYLEGQRSVR